MSASGPAPTPSKAPAAPERPEVPAEERNLAVLSHLSALAGLLIPFGHVLAPLVIWLVKRDESPFVADHAKEALNFQISVTLWGIAATVLTYVLIGFLFLAILGVLELVCIILASLHASRGRPYRYPVTVRLIS